MKHLLLAAVVVGVMAVTGAAQAGPHGGEVQLAGYGHRHHHHHHRHHGHHHGHHHGYYRSYSQPYVPYYAPPVYRSYYYPGNNFYYRGPNFGVQFGF